MALFSDWLVVMSVDIPRHGPCLIGWSKVFLLWVYGLEGYLTSIDLIGWSPGAYSLRMGCKLSFTCSGICCVFHSVTHLFFYFPGSSDSVFLMLYWSWPFHIFQVGSCIFLHVSFCWFKVLKASFLEGGFVVMQTYNLTRKILTKEFFFQFFVMWSVSREKSTSYCKKNHFEENKKKEKFETIFFLRKLLCIRYKEKNFS